MASQGPAGLELDPFVKELKVLSESSGLTVEELIGRDGQEFVTNLKKLQKS